MLIALIREYIAMGWTALKILLLERLNGDGITHVAVAGPSGLSAAGRALRHETPDRIEVKRASKAKHLHRDGTECVSGETAMEHFDHNQGRIPPLAPGDDGR